MGTAIPDTKCFSYIAAEGLPVAYCKRPCLLPGQVYLRLRMSDRRHYTLLFNFSSLGIIQVAGFLLSLVVIPYVIRIIGADGFGIIAVAQVLMFYMSVTADYGFNRTAIRDVALYKNDPERISGIFFTVLASKLFITVLLFLLLLVLVAIIPLFRLHYEVYLLAFSFVIGQSLLVNWFFQGLEKMQYMAVASFFSRLVFVAMVLLFLKDKNDISLYIFFMGLGNCIAGLASIFFAVKKYKLSFSMPSMKAILYELKEGWPVTLTNLSQTSIQYIGIFILRLFSNDLVVGYYSIAERIYFAMKLMLDVFSQAAYPRICLLLQEGISPVKKFFRQIFLPFLGITASGATVVAILSPRIIHFFMGQTDGNSVLLLRMLCLALIIVCLGIPANLLLLAGDHKKNYLRVFTIGTLINIVANFSLAPVFFGMGTVFSVILTEVIIVLLLYRDILYLYGRKDKK